MVLLAVTAAAVCAGAEWKLFRHGHIDLVTDGPDRRAQESLNVLIQAANLVARFTGKADPQPLWPLRLIAAEKSPRKTQLVLVDDAYTTSWPAVEPVPREVVAQYARLLMEASLRGKSEEFEKGLAAVLSTLTAQGPRVRLGEPVAAAERSREWARMHMLATSEEYAGRVRVLFANLEGGAPLDTSYRNAFEKPAKEIEKQVDAYLSAGRFEAVPFSGVPLNPERQLRPRPLDAARAQPWIADAARTESLTDAELASEATNESENARAWLARADALTDLKEKQDALLRAAKLNPRWPEPYLRLADMETDLNRRVFHWKKALSLDPRNTDLKARIASTEAKETDRRAEESAKELARLKQEAEARVRAAEAQARAAAGPSDPAQKVVDWWDGPRPQGKVTGALERVDCMGAKARLSIREAGGKLVQLMVTDPSQVVFSGAGEMTLGCGPQKPPRRLTVEYVPKNDAKSATVGEVAFVEFLQ